MARRVGTVAEIGMVWQVGLYLAAIGLPLAGAVASASLGDRWRGRGAVAASVGSIASACLLSWVGLFAYMAAANADPVEGRGPVAWRASADWISVPGLGNVPLSIPVGVAIDNLSALMFAMVTTVALAVMVYSVESMRDDPGRSRFLATLSLFCSAMLGLVAASNLFALFLCWELVGFCSYLLVGFWYKVDLNAKAGNKAFVVNRIGDVGMLTALGVLWSQVGSVDFATLNALAIGEGGASPAVDPSWLGLASLGIFAGCAAKSAQFPLHTWLPDAMSGPTPASALIHAATMVAAGVYLIARVMPIFPPGILLVVAYAGAITLLLAATVASVQTDYKKVLAFSTISQLGFMMVALGVGGRSAGLFHLMTHAFFKATLFLCAGSVYRATHTYQMAELGGLYPRMKGTALAMLAATLAISGVPFFSGFASKDAILASTLHFVADHPGHFLLFWGPVAGAALTAFYMFRLWFLVFAEGPRTEAARDATESPRGMLGPIIALAVPSVAVGWTPILLPLFGFEPVLERWLKYGEPIASVDPGDARMWATGASVLVASIGMGLGILAYGPWKAWKRLDPGRTAQRFGPVHRFLAHRWYLDELYLAAIQIPLHAVARLLAFFDRKVLDADVERSARWVDRLARANGWADRVVVDGLVRLVGSMILALGRRGQALQTGRLPHYMMGLAAAVLGLFAALFAWSLA